MPIKDPKKRAEYNRAYAAKRAGEFRSYHEEYNRRPYHRWIQHRNLCAKRGMEFTITREEYVAMADLPCAYCGASRYGTGIGLDRIDNARGYTPTNILPCCGACNHARNDNFTSEEMMREIGPAIRRVRLARGEVLAGVAKL